MPTYPELYILRHGETHWNAEHRMQGGLNSPLTQTGRDQAAQQARILETVDLTGFTALCSPQGRAFETAAIVLARQVPLVRTDDRLREIGVGDWQGKLRSGLKVSGPLHETPDGPIALYEQAPNGEGFARLEVRCRDFLDSLDGPAVLVTHGITSRMLRAILLDLGRDGVATLPGGQGVVYHLKNGVQNLLS